MQPGKFLLKVMHTQLLSDSIVFEFSPKCRNHLISALYTTSQLTKAMAHPVSLADVVFGITSFAAWKFLRDLGTVGRVICLPRRNLLKFVTTKTIVSAFCFFEAITTRFPPRKKVLTVDFSVPSLVMGGFLQTVSLYKWISK